MTNPKASGSQNGSFEIQRTSGISPAMQSGEISVEAVDAFVSRVKSIISQAKDRAGRAVNFSMVEAYWQVGKEVIERQGGAERAKYGDGLIKASVARLRGELGKNVDERELRKMRQFYLLFPIRDALRPELGWSHYREMLSVRGQMDGYVRMYEERYRRPDDNPTIGLLLCSKKNEAVAKYSVLNESRQLFASRYVLELPTEDELRKMIEQGRRSLASSKGV